MKKIIIALTIFLITFCIIFLNIFSKEEKEKVENKNISIILETEEGNIESNTFPSKEDYEYSDVVCENTNDEVDVSFNEETWKLNLSVEEDSIDGNFNCTVHFRENTPPNPPVLDGDMVPVYYDEAGSVWRKADENNESTEHKWYDYSNGMWANSVTYDHTKVVDLSSKNNIGEIHSATYTSEGISFDGVDDFVDGGYENYDFGNTITLIARFKTSEYNTINSSVFGNPNVAGTYIRVTSTGLIYFAIFGETNNGFQRVFSTETYELNKWYTVVGTYDGSTLKLYINGELNNTVAVIDTIKVTDVPFFVGTNPERNGNHIEYFKGDVSDAIVIDGVLSESEIKENYSNEVNYKENSNTLFAYDLQGYEGRSNGEIVPMEAISTMQVWIPRYKYKVWNYNLDGTSTSSPEQIDIRFERGTASTGDITCTDNIQGSSGDGTSKVCKINNSPCTDSLCNGKYYTHPAFTFGSEELTGFWVGKFEVGTTDECTPKTASLYGEGCNTTSITPLSKPNINSWAGAMLGVYDNNIRAMNDSGNIYGFTNESDTHVIKNMEWGAVSYLSHSKFGVVNKVELNSNNLYITGCGPQTSGSISSGDVCNSYNTIIGQLASTTENIYGVYDMSGGSWEYVMGALVSTDGSTKMSGYQLATDQHSGFNGLIYENGNYTNFDGHFTFPESKYYDLYSYSSSGVDRKRSKLGDAIKEVYLIGDSSWYNGYSRVHYTEFPWLMRGAGSLSGNQATIFTSYSVSGRAVEGYGTRLSIAVN